MQTQSGRSGWFPVTFGGVASFGAASGVRLFLLQLSVAVWVSLTIVWFVAAAWFPVVDRAAAALPARSRLEGGRLIWGGSTPALLAENPFLSIAVNAVSSNPYPSASDLQIELLADGVKVRSLLGYVALPYPGARTVGLGRTEVQSWWGAWRPALMLMIGVLTLGLVLLIWWAAALVGSPVVAAIAFYADRQLERGGSWRVAGAGLLPAAIVWTIVLWLYGLGRFDMLLLGLGWAAHLIVGIIYLLVAPFWLPRTRGARCAGPNPFRTG